MKLLIFAGSTRLNSYNRRLAQFTATLARAAGAEVTLLELGELDIPLYNADLEARGTPADVIRLKTVLSEHPAWIICSPEYNASYTALLKNTIDWSSSPVKGDAQWSDGLKPFSGKVVGLLSASPGSLGGLRSLEHLCPLLRNLQCWMAPKQYALGNAGTAFDENGQLLNETQRQGVQAVVDEVLWAGQRLSAKRIDQSS
ncbi:MAG: NAD(P)H-dependent oxidoreductase [Rhodoferax sp.]|nr:NAD(P)H-dependent oxidoreductase [Rhodoferax sp.]